MQDNNTHTLTQKQILADTRSKLLKKNIIIKLIFGIFILTASFVVLEFFFEGIYFSLCSIVRNDLIYDKYYYAFQAVMITLNFFMLSPLFLGLCRLSAMLANRGSADFIEIFAYYASFKAFWRSLLVSLIVFLPFLMSLLALLIWQMVLPLKYALATVCVLWLIFIKTRLFTFINAFVCGGDQPLRLFLKSAIRSTKRSTAKLLLFSLRFIPWILLSIPTLGVLLLIFVLPYILFAESRYSSYLLTGEYKNYISEETL